MQSTLKLTKFDLPLRKETGSAGMQPASAKTGGSVNSSEKKGSSHKKAASYVKTNINPNQKLNLKPHIQTLCLTNLHYCLSPGP